MGLFNFNGDKKTKCVQQEDGTFSCARVDREDNVSSNVNFGIDPKTCKAIINQSNVQDGDEEALKKAIKSSEEACRQGLS